jgi:hypothetical protein
MKKQLLVLVLGAISAQPAVAAPPEPPLGKRWSLNPKFSDEFDGTTLEVLAVLKVKALLFKLGVLRGEPAQP